MDSRFSEIARFREELHRHIDEGTGHPNSSSELLTRWDPVSLERALAEATRKRGRVAAIPSLRTVRNWLDRKQDYIPQERYLESILDVFFENDIAGRKNFHALWEAARQARREFGADNASDTDRQAIATDRWRVSEAENIGLGLAALHVHPSPKSNTEDDSFLLQVSLSLSQYSDEIEGLSVMLGLKAAYLRLDHTHCQPRPMEENLDYVKERGGVYVITGPVMNGHLDGRPLSNTTLVTMERTDVGAANVTVSLRSRVHDLEVTPEDPDVDISATKAKILQTFLQRCHVSENDRQLIWGRATLTEAKCA